MGAEPHVPRLVSAVRVAAVANRLEWGQPLVFSADLQKDTVLGRGDIVTAFWPSDAQMSWFIRPDTQPSVLLPDNGTEHDTLIELDKLNKKWAPSRDPGTRDVLQLIRMSLLVMPNGALYR